jgi:hypothetical protein
VYEPDLHCIRGRIISHSALFKMKPTTIRICEEFCLRHTLHWLGLKVCARDQRPHRRRDLQRDGAVQSRVAGFVNGSHATCADRRKDFVRAEFVAWREASE